MNLNQLMKQIRNWPSQSIANQEDASNKQPASDDSSDAPPYLATQHTYHERQLYIAHIANLASAYKQSKPAHKNKQSSYLTLIKVHFEYRAWLTTRKAAVKSHEK